ncbi:butyrate kinase [Anaeromyxobacter paludicola]|uniref:Butyrate kinase 2 n=1 Tax=Anaeromyxobacter paludicola TaxID=2918171 RepID=A0ABM7XCZ4_9BACT|nr:butyrate kinase [Anaeromyxobacter paludicola]BDG09740.1 putative butyrate kinase 2 [Anaeromyxobacter paludicola]
MGQPNAAVGTHLGGNIDPLGVAHPPPVEGVPRGAPLVLAVNPAPGVTRLGLFEGERLVRSAAVQHSERSLRACRRLLEQQDFRLDGVRGFLTAAGVQPGRLAAAVGQGGLLPRALPGTYLVDDALLREQAQAAPIEHEANLGAPIVHALASEHGCPAYVVDPVDEAALDALARLGGARGPVRTALTHALNMRLVARRHASGVNRPTQEMKHVVAHLGDGFSLAALRGGVLLDAVTSLAPVGEARGDSIETALAAACAQPGADARSVAAGLFGARALQPTLSGAQVLTALARAERGERTAFLLLEAVSYQLAKVVGELATVLEGEVDGILLTGGLTSAGPVVSGLSRRVEWIAPVFVYPGEEELRALADGALRALSGAEQALRYPRC